MLDKNKPLSANPPSLKVDWEVYAQMLEETDMSDAEKRKFIETIWSLVMTFVDLGFGLTPVQQVCGESFSLDEMTKGDVVSSPSSKICKEFNRSAEPQFGDKRKRSPVCKSPKTP